MRRFLGPAVGESAIEQICDRNQAKGKQGGEGAQGVESQVENMVAKKPSLCKLLKEKGPVTVPREFVFMDRAAIGLGAAYLRLGAELNYHRLFEESLDGFSEESMSDRQMSVLSQVELLPNNAPDSDSR